LKATILSNEKIANRRSKLPNCVGLQRGKANQLGHAKMRSVIAVTILMALSWAISLPALAGVSWSGSAAVTSDYKFRGISQTEGDAAVQVGVDFTHDSGLYAGIWGSNVDLGSNTDVEIDLTLGFTHEFSETTSAGVRAVYYAYPGSDVSGADYWELIADASHKFGPLTASVEFAYTPDYYANTDSGMSIKGGLEAALCDWMTASGNAGQQSYDDNVAVDLPDYIYWDLGATLSHGSLSLDLRYVDTDLKSVDCYGGSDLCRGKFVATLSVEFSSAEEEAAATATP
jgi:uncharacterized protein (TIGR02001 family)